MESSLDNLMEQWNNSIPGNQDQVFNIKGLVSQLLNAFPILVKESLRYSPIILDDQANWSQLDSNKYYEFTSLNGGNAPDASKLGDSQGIVFILKTSSSYKFMIAFTKYGIATKYRDNKWNYISYSSDDSNAVHNTGDEEIAGKKTFDVAPIDKTTGNPYITKDPMDKSLGSLTSFKPTGSNLIDKLNNEFNDRGVNVKWFGAKGDGVTDDTLSIQSAIDTGRSIFLPPGKYNVTELTGFAAGQIIQGISKAESWGAQDSQNITLLNGIGSSDNYVIKNRIGGSEGGDGTITAITVRNLSIEGSKKTNGILVGASSSIVNVRVHNCKTGFASVKASTIENCFITGCENGFYDITDSRFTNNFIYLNDVGINLTYSNDNIISNNKIEWNGIGISIDRAGCDLISNNIFDRSTTYGIYTTNAYQLTITGNLFKRNLTNHLYLGGSKFNISANSFYRGNSKDNQTGIVVPDVAIFTKYVEYSSITSNLVDGKMFNTTGTYHISNVNISANIINGINPDNIIVVIPETTVVHGQDTKIIIPLPSYFDGALNNPYNVEILSQKISFTTQSGNFYYNGGIIKSIYMSTSGIELTIFNNLNDDLKVNGTIQVGCVNQNLY